MRLESKKSKVKNLFVQDIIVADKKNENIEQGICRPTGSIPEGLQRHNPFKRRVEKINYRNNLLFGHKLLNVAVAKVV
jgi:hypothetical protein